MPPTRELQPRFRWALLPVIVLGGLLQCAAQDASPPPTATPSPAAAASLANTTRPISWKLLLPNLYHDQKPIWLFPKTVGLGQHVKPTLAVVLATASLVALDPHDAPYFRRTQTFSGFNQVFSGRNTFIAMTAFPLSFYLAGLARQNSYAQGTVLLAGESVIDAGILTTVMKDVDRRLRPADVSPGGDFGHTWFRGHGSWLSGRGSFPSGHTIAAFSMATVFADRYPRPRWHRWVAFGLAGVVGFSRVTLQAHFPSDVFAGAALGYGIAHYAVLRQP